MTLKLLLTILHIRRDQEVYSFNSRMLTLVQDCNFHLHVLGEGTVKELFKKFALFSYLQKDPAKLSNQDKTEFAMVESTEAFVRSLLIQYLAIF